MLHAIDRNKFGQSIKESEIHWKQLFKASEDSLTSSVFGQLLYLPIDISWKIIKDSCSCELLPENCGELLSVEFWPKWRNQNSDRSYVEPDVFLSFDDFDVIVEAKKNDQPGLQDLDISQKEFEAIFYRTEFPTNKKAYLISLGGNSDFNNNEVIENVNIIKCRWKDIMENSITALHNLKIEKRTSDHLISVLNDLIRYFELHGFHHSTWLEDLPDLIEKSELTISHLAEKTFKEKNYE